MQVIDELRRLGFEIEADGDRVRVRHQSQPQSEALSLLSYIRQHKAEVLTALAEEHAATFDNELPADVVAEAPRSSPKLPQGLQLVSYTPKRPPVALEQCSIVTNVELFIQTSLGELESRLRMPDAVHYGRSVPQILDRLRQVGLVIEVAPSGIKKSEK